MAIKGKNKAKEGKTYLFQTHPTLPALSMFAAASLSETQGQLYGLFEGKLVPVDAYDSRADGCNHHIYECLGQGQIVGRVFPNGVLSDDLKKFLRNPENKKYEARFIKGR